VRTRAEPLKRIGGPAGGGRVIVVGDIHGCIDELRELLDRIAPGPEDTVISAGDIVRKGPRPDLCLELWRQLGYLAVIGNNDEKLLALATPAWMRWLLPQEDRAVVRRPDLTGYIEQWPVLIDIPSIRACVVHGGLFPDSRIEPAYVAECHNDLIRMRYIRRCGNTWQRVPKGKEQPTDVLWSREWHGDRTVLYGHTPVREPRIDEKAIGLDTGCVYGGELTAAVHEHGAWRVESVRARRAYAKR
jgi:predicted phosphodiesterase